MPQRNDLSRSAAHARVARLGEPLLPPPGAALLRRARQAGVAGHRPSVPQVAREDLVSGLAAWYRVRTADARGGTRKTMIVALARKLLIALWRLVTTGETPEGIVLRVRRRERARPKQSPRDGFAARPWFPGGLAMTIRGGGDPGLPMALMPH